MAELALVAARHRPRDLHPRPRLDHLARAAVDVDLDDLLVVREEADLPAPVVSHLLACREPASLGGELGHLGLVARDLVRLVAVDRELRWRRWVVRGRRGSWA